MRLIMDKLEAARCVLILFAMGIWPADVEAGIAGLEQVGSGLTQLMSVAHAPGDRDRLFVVERPGTIKVLNLPTGVVQPSPFLFIPGVMMQGEGGFLGLAFHPDYQANGKFYVNITVGNANPDSPFSNVIREYTVSSDPNIANTTFKTIIEWEQPQANHNGGWIGFGPNDGYLYLMSGDGGNRDDTGPGHTEQGGNAQDITDNRFGKALRLDVNGDQFPADPNRNYAIPPTNPFVGIEGDDEIWAYGLRNPYRAGFDRATGDLWIGDVGQDFREEVNFQPGSSPGGENYGWRLREGLIATPTGGVGGPKPPGNVDPVYDYLLERWPNDGPFTGNTVIGGLVYRGPDPELQGTYFFADAGTILLPSTNKFWTMDADAVRQNPDALPAVTDIKPLLIPDVGVPDYPLSFGEDAVGNLYIVYGVSNNVYRVVTDALTPGDFDADADVDENDLAAWTASFGMTNNVLTANGDADGDADVDGADFLAWQRNLGWSPLNVTPPTAAVPEPAGIAMMAASAITLVAARRRQAT
jgi:glucose/arabinose dehydrogenase